MEPLEQLIGHDSYKYLGVMVSVTMTTGDHLKGELYCLDQRGQTLVLKSELGEDSFSFHILRLSSIIKFEVIGRLNDSIYDIQRLSYEDLAAFKPMLNRTEDNHSKKTH